MRAAMPQEIAGQPHKNTGIFMILRMAVFFSVNFCWNVGGTTEPLRQQQGLGRDFVEVTSPVFSLVPPTVCGSI